VLAGENSGWTSHIVGFEIPIHRRQDEAPPGYDPRPKAEDVGALGKTVIVENHLVVQESYVRVTD